MSILPHRILTAGRHQLLPPIYGWKNRLHEDTQLTGGSSRLGSLVARSQRSHPFTPCWLTCLKWVLWPWHSHFLFGLQRSLYKAFQFKLSDLVTNPCSFSVFKVTMRQRRKKTAGDLLALWEMLRIISVTGNVFNSRAKWRAGWVLVQWG